MIVFDAAGAIDMTEFGVGVAQSGSRAGIILEKIRQSDGLGERIGDWLDSGPLPDITREDLLRVHAPDYVDLLLSENPDPAVVATYELVDENGDYHRYDPKRAKRPLKGLVTRSLRQAAGTSRAAALALERGFAFFLGGGMHHAHYDQGRGFCLTNDIVIAVRKLRAEGLVKTVRVVDLDAHRGDGVAALCIDDPDTLCLSIHMARGWPLDELPLDERGRLYPWHWPGDIDIPVPEGGEERYLPSLEKGLALLEELSFGAKPDLVVVVDGADPFEEDELPSASLLRLSAKQMLDRDMLVYDWLERRGVPQCWLMAGGYGKNAWKPHTAFLETVLPRRLSSSSTNREPEEAP